MFAFAGDQHLASFRLSKLEVVPAWNTIYHWTYCPWWGVKDIGAIDVNNFKDIVNDGVLRITVREIPYIIEHIVNDGVLRI